MSTGISLSALALVMTGAACHALWNIAVKRAAGGLAFVWLFGLVSTCTLAPFATWTWYLHPQVFDATMWFSALASEVTGVTTA